MEYERELMVGNTDSATERLGSVRHRATTGE